MSIPDSPLADISVEQQVIPAAPMSCTPTSSPTSGPGPTPGARSWSGKTRRRPRTTPSEGREPRADHAPVFDQQGGHRRASLWSGWIRLEERVCHAGVGDGAEHLGVAGICRKATCSALHEFRPFLQVGITAISDLEWWLVSIYNADLIWLTHFCLVQEESAIFLGQVTIRHPL